MSALGGQPATVWILAAAASLAAHAGLVVTARALGEVELSGGKHQIPIVVDVIASSPQARPAGPLRTHRSPALAEGPAPTGEPASGSESAPTSELALTADKGKQAPDRGGSLDPAEEDENTETPGGPSQSDDPSHDSRPCRTDDSSECEGRAAKGGAEATGGGASAGALTGGGGDAAMSAAGGAARASWRGMSDDCWAAIGRELNERARTRLPRTIRERGLVGEVGLYLRLNGEAEAESIKVERSSGTSLLDAAALALVQGPFTRGCFGEGRWTVKFARASGTPAAR